MMMGAWNKPLNKENMDEFFHMFAAPAYKSAYRILGDTTRTENALTESFLELYHSRHGDENRDLVFMFSDILQRRVEALASRYPVTETSRNTNRVLDEFTENSILDEIHRRLESVPYRVLEIFTSTASGKNKSNSDPFWGQLQKTGITLFLLLQLILAAALIYGVTVVSTGKVFKVNELAPSSPSLSEISIAELLGPVMNYLPLNIRSAAASESSNAAGGTQDTTPGSEGTDAAVQSITVTPGSGSAELSSVASGASLTTPSSDLTVTPPASTAGDTSEDSTVASATRG
jgi:hypothetical protein